MYSSGTSDWTFNVTTTPTVYTFDVVFTNMKENTHQEVKFMLGMADEVVYIDSVMLTKDSDLKLSARSLAKSKSTVHLYPNPVQHELTISRIGTTNSKIVVCNALVQKKIKKMPLEIRQS